MVISILTREIRTWGPKALKWVGLPHVREALLTCMCKMTGFEVRSWDPPLHYTLYFTKVHILEIGYCEVPLNNYYDNGLLPRCELLTDSDSV